MNRHPDEILAIGWDRQNKTVLSLDRKLMLDRGTYDQPAPSFRFRPVFPTAGDRGEGKILAVAATGGTQFVAVAGSDTVLTETTSRCGSLLRTAVTEKNCVASRVSVRTS